MDLDFLFDWDAANVDHIALHDITPQEVEQVVQNEPVERGGTLRNGEERILHLGETNAKRVLFVVTTMRNGKIRPVTARPARRKERDFYSKPKASIDEQDTQDP